LRECSSGLTGYDDITQGPSSLPLLGMTPGQR
jgi:hypothetical protein